MTRKKQIKWKEYTKDQFRYELESLGVSSLRISGMMELMEKLEGTQCNVNHPDSTSMKRVRVKFENRKWFMEG